MECIKTQNQTMTVFYLALQYLSNASRCYLPKQPRNKHLDLVFSIADDSFVVYPSEDSKCVFLFNYKRLTLEWTVNNLPKVIRLNGTSHRQLLKWIRMVFKEAGFEKTYKYISKNKERFPIDDSYVFELEEMIDFERMVHLRVVAHQAIQKILKDHDWVRPIRIQSFTLSSYVKVKWKTTYDVSMLFGFAIPNSMIDQHYCYVICYHGNRKITITGMPPLRNGYWVDNDVVRGAVLLADTLTPRIAAAFFNEVLRAYRKKIFHTGAK